jgi:NADH dehydrogenase
MDATSAATSGPKVVIVGAGFGGLEAARALAGAPARVTVIDRENHHTFQPLLYQIATAALSPADVAWPIRHILQRQDNATVIMAAVQGINVEARLVHTDSIRVPYDFLVVATGATHSYFGHDEWAAFAPGLKRIEDAIRIRRRFLTAFEQAELTEEPSARERFLTFVIVGGGPTGVEMAGAMAEVARQTLAADFRRSDPRSSRILLVEAGPRLLPVFPEKLSDYARRALERMGVEVRTEAPVTLCDADGVVLEGGQRIPAATVIWAAGVVASPVATWLGAAHDRAGRVKVELDLSVPGRPEIFVVGDAVSVRDPAGNPVPGIAPAAKQMGAYVGKRIRSRIAGEPPSPPFRYVHHGDLATIGRRSAVVNLRRLRLKGVAGWLFWSVAHIYFLIGLRNRFVVAFNWFWDYVTFQRGARLITQDRPPDS